MLDHKNVIFNRLTVQPQKTNSLILSLIYRYIHIDISLIQSFLITVNTVNKFYYPQLFYHTSPVYPRKNTNCDVSKRRFRTNCVCIYIYIYIYIYILCSNCLWPFRRKLVAKNKRINCCVFTGLVILVIVKSTKRMNFLKIQKHVLCTLSNSRVLTTRI